MRRCVCVKGQSRNETLLCTGLALTAGALMAVEAAVSSRRRGGQRGAGAQTINAPAVGDLEVIQLDPTFT